MTPDQLRHEETRAWLDRARRDLRAAKLLIAGDANAEALFHCQQAVEKAIKAFLTFHERTFRKTHDLGDLSSECLAIDDSLRPVVSQAEGLTQYAWLFRYPGEPYEPEPGREFRPGAKVGSFRLADLQAELSRLFSGRKVDLRTPMDLSHYFRDEVVRDALVVYAEP